MMHAIFDLDGTLVDSVLHTTGILNHMLEERGSTRRVTDQDARPYISVGGERMVEALLGPECGNPADEIAQFRSRYLVLPTPHNCLFDGVKEGLERLAASGIALSICSNKPQALCEKVLADLRIADKFVSIVGGGAGRAPKPATDLLDHVLALIGAEKDRCCFIGDGAPDFLSAKAAGVKFVFAGYGYAEPEESFEGAIRCADFAAVVAQVRAVLHGSAVEPSIWGKAAA